MPDATCSQPPQPPPWSPNRRALSHKTFTADLVCEVHGTAAALGVGPGVLIQGNNHCLIGTGDGTGVLYDGAHGRRVTGPHVTGFAHGVIFRAAAGGNWFDTAWVWGNAQHGVWLDQDAYSHGIWRVNAMGNRVSGVMLSDAPHNVVVQTIAWDNPTAIALVNADANWLLANAFYSSHGRWSCRTASGTSSHRIFSTLPVIRSC